MGSNQQYDPSVAGMAQQATEALVARRSDFNALAGSARNVGGMAKPGRDPNGPTFIQDQIHRVMDVTAQIDERNKGLASLIERIERHVSSILGPEPPLQLENGRAPAESRRDAAFSMEALQVAIGASQESSLTTGRLLDFLAHQVERLERL